MFAYSSSESNQRSAYIAEREGTAAVIASTLQLEEVTATIVTIRKIRAWPMEKRYHVKVVMSSGIVAFHLPVLNKRTR